MQKYLAESEYVDFSHPEIKLLASYLAGNLSDDAKIAEACFVYVRDEITS